MRKSKIYGITGTAIIGGLILLLFLLVQITSKQEVFNEPVVINLGDMEDAAGPAVTDPGPPATVVPSQPASVKSQKGNPDENLASQMDESPVTTVEKKQNKPVKPSQKQLEENRKRIQEELFKQEQTRKVAAQQAAIADKARQMGSVFGANHGSGSGDGQSGDGVKGNPLGKVGGTGVVASVSGRTVTSTPSPSYTTNDEGKVTVNVTVDNSGSVIKAYIGSATTTSEVLRDAALQAARRSKFSAGTHEAVGTITYRFILK
jgi:TonB family protein